MQYETGRDGRWCWEGAEFKERGLPAPGFSVAAGTEA